MEFILWLVGSMVSERGGKYCAHSTELDGRLVAVPNSYSYSQSRSYVDIDALQTYALSFLARSKAIGEEPVASRENSEVR